MAHVRHFKIPFERSGQVNLTDISAEENKTTILLGENGTKKSLLLRQIVIEALSLFGADLKEANKAVGFSGTPARVVTISATATDRFPSRPKRGEIAGNSRFDLDTYNYVGPRSARNIISRSHSLSELILALLSRPEVIKNRAKFFKKMAIHIGLPLEIQFRLSVTNSWPASLKSQKLKTFEEYIIAVTSSDTRRSSNIARAMWRHDLTHSSSIVRELDSHLFRLDEVLPEHGGFSKKRDIELKLNLVESKFEVEGVRPEALAAAFDAGYLVPMSASLGGSHESSFSAGQWALFSTLFTLAAVAEDNSIVLVDEPENGLHPNWQRNYLGWLYEALENCQGCHLIIATHSPLVVGSLFGVSSEVVVLKRRRDVVSASVVEAPSGWDVNSILEDVFNISNSRGKEVTEIIEASLSLVAAGVEKNIDKLLARDSKLVEIRDILPADDDLVIAINAIRKLYLKD